MRLIPFILFSYFAASLLLANENEKLRDQTFVSYQWSGGHSTYRKVTVDIRNTGDVEVPVEKHQEHAFSYRTELSNEEMGALNTLIASTQFFLQHDLSTTLVTHTGKTEITIAGGAETKTLRYLHLPELNPLQAFLWKLVNQADALDSIEADKDIYSAVGTVNPRLAGAKVLQPDRFQAPLISYVKSSTDRQKIQWALEALAWITP